jgi:aspartyl/glutamyl-tRNA(Asn/Gln) amidotransferase C subunit
MKHPKIDKEKVEHLEWLARVHLSPDEKTRMMEEIDLLLGYIDDIFSIDVGDKEEYLYPSPGHYRKDIVTEKGDGISLLNNAMLEKRHVKAPSVVEKDEGS